MILTMILAGVFPLLLMIFLLPLLIRCSFRFSAVLSLAVFLFSCCNFLPVVGDVFSSPCYAGFLVPCPLTFWTPLLIGPPLEGFLALKTGFLPALSMTHLSFIFKVVGSTVCFATRLHLIPLYHLCPPNVAIGFLPLAQYGLTELAW